MTAQQRYENDNFMYLHTIFFFYYAHVYVYRVFGFYEIVCGAVSGPRKANAIIIAYARWRCECGRVYNCRCVLFDIFCKVKKKINNVH